ncbi:thioredoxin domain-containing protein 15-like [Argiope bruennichi]|uniref:thioredoxin domain-containing protein 15-like n=1 Tax=Argiope bruennichi TaxID=94029 RepID=UPI0024940AA2|nr:thioredoxin domain-containing protein 15-like [Argiope bruennichi]
MECFKALCFILVLVAVAGDEEEADVTVEFSSHLTDRPIENAKNASIVTSDEIETRVPYDNDHQKLSAVYGIDPNTSSLYENFELLNTENNTVQATETNSTSNATDTKSKMKVECTPRVLPENEVPTVTVANSSTLLKVLAPVANKNSTIGDCVVVLFYSNQCVFSARMAPHFNALPRVFPDIAFYAVDVIETGNLYVRYGLVFVPNVMLFHNSKPFARYNETALNLDQFVKFINKFTGLTHNGTLNVTSADMIGPVPSTLTKRIDYVLILAWVFTLCCFCFGFAKSSFCKCTVEFFRNTWYEANATQHEHEE